MERGLLWLPLLVLFIGLAWAGWNEFQKVESYRRWAQPFRYSKYDIYSVLALDEDSLVVGKPSRQGPIQLEQVRFKQIRSVQLQLDGQTVASPSQALDDPKQSPKSIAIQLDLGENQLQIPFTQLDLAIDWTQRIQQELGQA